MAATVPVLALCGAIALTSQPSVSSAVARSAAGAAAASAAAFRPVADAQLPRTAVAEPALAPLGVTAQLLRTAAAAPSSAAPTTAVLVSDLASSGIPIVALQAYKSAARRLARTDPGCGLSWPLLAGIGRVESNHGRFGGAQLRADGTATQRIIGIPLNGHGTALIWDTDHGVLDGDKVYDRAVGPMQFIPSTWRSFASDGNGDGRADPFNIFDAALATARYLCVAGGNLSTPAGQQRAILTYNDSAAYLRLVLAMAHDYATGTAAVIPVLAAAAGTSQDSLSTPSRRSSSSAAAHGPASSSAPRSASSAPRSSASNSVPSSSSGGSSGPTSSGPTSSGPTSSGPTSSAAPSSSGSTSAQPTPSCTVAPSSSSSTSPTPKVSSSTTPTSSAASLSASNKTSTSTSPSDSPSATSSPSPSPTSCGAAAK